MQNRSLGGLRDKVYGEGFLEEVVFEWGFKGGIEIVN